MTERGLYLPDGSYKSRDEIMRQSAQENDEIEFITPIHEDNRSFRELANIMLRRQAERREANTLPEHIEINIKTDKPILLVPFGDIHAGAQEVDYKRFAQEAEWVSGTPGCYVMLFGDITDSYFWGGDAQDDNIGSFGEQNKFMKACMDMFSKTKRLLCAWGGDHDKWSSQRGDTIYADFGKQYNAHYLEGVSYVTLGVGEQTYRIVGAHRHNGFSIYNRSHPALRIARDWAGGGVDLDLAITAHTHRKAVLSQPVKRFGGDNELVHYMSLGAYKQTDAYGRKKGLGRLNKDEIGTQAILLYPNKKHIEVFWDVESGLEALNKARE